MATDTDRVEIDWTGGSVTRTESDDEAPEVVRTRKPRKDKGRPRAPKSERSESAPAPVERVPVDGWVADVLYEALGTLLVLGARWTGAEPDRALLMRFTKDEKDSLRQPTIAVLEKYAGHVGPYQEEIALGMALTAVLISKAEALRAPSVDYGTIPPPSVERPQ